MQTPLTPGEREQVLLGKARARFEAWLGRRLEELELAAFAHGWRAGERGQRLGGVVEEIDTRHPYAPTVLAYVAYGHHAGYSSFLRTAADFGGVQELLGEGGLEALIDDSEDEGDVGVLERLARLLEDRV